MDVKAYPGNEKYLVSVDGLIVSAKSGRALKPQVVTGGYLYVRLGRGGQYKGVHRLVAETWLPNLLNLLEVNHKDCDKTNNCVDNLEWSSRAENVRHASINKRGRQKLNPEIVSAIKKCRKEGHSYVSISAQFGVTKATVSHVVNQKTWNPSASNFAPPTAFDGSS